MHADPNSAAAKRSHAPWSNGAWCGRPVEATNLQLKTALGLDCYVTEWRLAHEEQLVRVDGVFRTTDGAGVFDLRLQADGLIFRDFETGRIGSPAQLLPEAVSLVYDPTPGLEWLAATKLEAAVPTPEEVLARNTREALAREFGATRSAWGIALWLAGVNSFLGGRRPVDLLAVDQELVLAAARDEMAGVQHG